VEDVLFGDIEYVDPAGSVAVYEEGFGVPPASSLVGDRGVYFLVARPAEAGAPPNYYHLTTSQGRFVFEADGVLVSGDLREWEVDLAGIPRRNSLSV
jgi:hypothetical protein